MSSASRIFPTRVKEVNGFGTNGIFRVCSGRSSAFWAADAVGITGGVTAMISGDSLPERTLLWAYLFLGFRGP